MIQHYAGIPQHKDKMKSIGSKIKFMRNQKGLSQVKLAEMAGISASHLSNVERGTFNGSITLLFKIADALEIDLLNVSYVNQVVLVSQSVQKQNKLSAYCVPMSWLLNIVGRDNLETFLNTYTLELSEKIKAKAKEDGVFKAAQIK